MKATSYPTSPRLRGASQLPAASTWVVVLFLELTAIALAILHFLGGVQTDEAKYLLNIPYPHPPLARWILSQTEWIPFQEILWRIIFASLMVQAVWLVMQLVRAVESGKRKEESERHFQLSTFNFQLICGLSWLLSSAVLLQSGSIMMAPLTALQAILFLWILARPEAAERARGWIALLWLASLFTAYQALLFAPLVATVLLRMKIPVWQRLLCLCAPVLLLILYTFVNPLALSSMFVHGAKDLHETFTERILRTGHVWILGGSGLLSILGTWGIVRSRRPELIASFLLVLAYVALARFDYYAILFTPLFVIGVLHLFNYLPRVAQGAKWGQFSIFLAMLIACTAFTLWFFPPSLHPGPARAVMQMIERGLPPEAPAGAKGGDILIAGPYGHEWQYESRFTVRRYVAGFLAGAQAVTCITPCTDIPEKEWQMLTRSPVDVWVKRD